MSWNAGKTKATDARVAKNAAAIGVAVARDWASVPAEARRRRTQAATTAAHSPAGIEKMRAAKTGRKVPKIGAARRGKKFGPQSEISRRRKAIAVSETLERKGHMYWPSSLERIVYSLLDSIGVRYVRQKRIERFVVDVFIPDRNVVVECDGLYWHSLPGAAEKDSFRDDRLRALGYTVLRLPEAAIRDGSFVGLLRSAS